MKQKVRVLPGHSGRAATPTERKLRVEAKQLALALTEATMQLPIWQQGAEHVDQVTSPTSRPGRHGVIARSRR